MLAQLDQAAARRRQLAFHAWSGAELSDGRCALRIDEPVSRSRFPGEIFSVLARDYPVRCWTIRQLGQCCEVALVIRRQHVIQVQQDNQLGTDFGDALEVS